MNIELDSKGKFKLFLLKVKYFPIMVMHRIVNNAVPSLNEELYQLYEKHGIRQSEENIRNS